MLKFIKSLFSGKMSRREREVRRAIFENGESLNFVARAYNLSDSELYLFTR